MSYLNDLKFHVIKVYMDGHMNVYVMGWMEFLQFLLLSPVVMCFHLGFEYIYASAFCNSVFSKRLALHASGY
jgi:hypothetical protein